MYQGAANFQGLIATAVGTFSLSFESARIANSGGRNMYFTPTTDFIRARGVSPTFVVGPDKAVNLRIVVQPPDLLLKNVDANSYVPMYTKPIVQAVDMYGNGVNGVTITAKVLNADLSNYTGNNTEGMRGTASVRTNAWESGGVSTFTDLRIAVASDGYALTLEFSAIMEGEIVAVNSGFFYMSSATTLLVNGLWAGAPAVPPPVAAGGSPEHSYTVDILQDLNGSAPIVLSSSGVTAKLLNSSGHAVQLYDVATKTRVDSIVAYPVNGVATFTGVAVVLSGSGFSLQFDYAGIIAQSASFNVIPGPPQSLRIVSQPKHAVAETRLTTDASPVVQIFDALGNLAVGVRADVTVKIQDVLQPGNTVALRLLLNDTLCATEGCALSSTNGTLSFRLLSIRGAALDAKLIMKLSVSGVAPPDVETRTFTVASRPPATMTMSSPPIGTLPADSPITITCRVVDTFLNEVGVVERGTLLAGDATSAQLSLLSHIENGFYTNMWISVSPSAGAAAGTLRQIVSYNGVTRTVRTSGAIDASAGHTYSIFYTANMTLTDTIRAPSSPFSSGAIVQADSLQNIVLFTGVDRATIRTGVATFTGVRIYRTGEYRFNFIAEQNPSARVVSPPFRVEPGEVALLMFTDTAANATTNVFAGLTADDVIPQFTLRVRDSSGNNVVTGTAQVLLEAPQVSLVSISSCIGAMCMILGAIMSFQRLLK
jgi:hypothetical protein